MKKLVLKLKRNLLVQTAALFGIGAAILFNGTSVNAQSTNPSPYCSTTHANMGNNGCANNWGFSIASVQLNGVTQNFSCNTGTVYRYYNASNLTTLKRGQTYTLRVQTASTVYATASAAWLDYGQNNSFAESGEFLGSQLGSNAPTLSYTFTVPGSATPGKTRMRVRCDYYSVMASSAYCGSSTNNYGETIDFDVEIEQVNYPDLAVGALIKPASVCGNNPDSVVVMLNNYGNATISNFPATCLITGTMGGSAVNQTFATTVSASIAVLGTYRLAFPSSLNTNNNGTLNFKIYTGVSNDGDRSNDTVTFSRTFYGTPANPGVSNVSRCGVGTVTLTSTPGNALDNVRWYSAASGGNTLGAGSTITSPFYNSSTTVYAQSSRNGATASFAPSTTGNTVYWGGTSNAQGGMMNLTPTKTMMINNIYIRKYYGYTANYKVFIRVGGYNGFENNSAAWTLAGSRNNVTGGSATMIPINIGGFVLEEGVKYGIYVQCYGDDFYLRYNPSPPFNESNSDMLLSNGSYLYGDFSGVVANYCIDVRYDYTTMCLSSRVPVAVTIKSVPNGTTAIKGATFNGAFNSGDVIDPDITASGDIIEYQVVPPSGYTNNTHGTTWSISNVSIRSKGGIDLPPANLTYTAPSGSTNANLRINPPASFTDSSMTLAITVTAIGCDTIFYRSFFFAPRPVTNFAAASVCEGTLMNFQNQTVLTSGSVQYTWHFGDGDSSKLINPAHAYASKGSFTASLRAVSNYGYTSTISKTVVVKENPTAEFGHTNTCQGAPVPFTDASIIPIGTPTYEWNFGDGSALGSGATLNHQYASTGVYLVKMKVTANGCSDEASQYVTYSPRAVPNFNTSAVSCNSDVVKFTNTSTLSQGQMGYSWNFGDNTISTQINPSHSYTSFGTINITLTVSTDQGCVNQISKQITLKEAPHVAFSNGLLCDKKDVDFTNMTVEPASALTTYTWTFNDGSSYSSKDISKSFPGIGNYTVTLSAFADNGCTDAIIKTIALEETPIVQFYATEVCDGSAMNFQNATVGNGGNLNYAWDFGSSGTSNALNPVKVLPLGQTNVKLTASTPGSGCTSSYSKMVNVNVNPASVSMLIETGKKGDGTFTLNSSVTPADASYVIFWGDGGREPGVAVGGQINSIYSYLIDGSYIIKVRLTKGNCSSEAVGSASVNRTGLVNISEGSIKTYPNPSNGIFNLDLSGINTNGLNIEVYAANGQLINGNVSLNGEIAQLDMSAATPGVYIVKVNTSNGVHTTRITLNK